MAEMITFEVPGEVRGKMRPRFTNFGGYTRAYKPAKEVNYEQWVKLCYQKERENKDFKGFEDRPIFINVIVHKAVPTSTSKKKEKLMLDDEIHNDKKPDVDNVLKAIMDALNGIAYKDDKQVVQATVCKFYANEDKAIITIGDYVKDKTIIYGAVHEGISTDDDDLAIE